MNTNSVINLNKCQYDQIKCLYSTVLNLTLVHRRLDINQHDRTHVDWIQKKQFIFRPR